MKKKVFVTSKDKKEWYNFIKKIDNVYDKDSDVLTKNYRSNKIKKIDLHGFSLDEANIQIKKFIMESYEEECKKLIVVTGKGSRSKVYGDPFRSNKMNVLRYSVPHFIQNETDLINKIKKISEAEIKDGGEGALYIFLKDKNKFKE